MYDVHLLDHTYLVYRLAWASTLFILDRWAMRRPKVWDEQVLTPALFLFVFLIDLSPPNWGVFGHNNIIMKRLISLTTTFLCIITIICVIGCKKKSDITPNNGGGETPTPVEADFFVDVDFLPKIETNGELAPRLMANYNDEVVMIELRPYTDTLIETVLFLCPDNKACMLCGNDTRLIYAEYDLETYTPSNDVILVTSKADTALLITKCIMDWSTNTMMTGDMMILPINNNTKNGKTKGHDEDIRVHFYNNFVIPLSKEFDKVQSFFGSWGSPAGSMIACINSIYSTAAPIIMFSDEPELLVENMEYPTTMGIGQAAQVGILRLFPQNLSEMASRIISGLSWYLNGGSGEVNNYGGGSGGSNALSYANILCQANSVISVSTLADPEPMYSLSLNVSNITENSAYLRGNIYYNSGTTPAEMGYVYQVSGGPEYTEEDMGFHGKTINGLQKATKYTAYAYAKSIMGDRVISPAVTFWTLGFEAFPNSLTFPAEGDTKYVSLSYSEGDISGWEVTSGPSWCSVTKDGDKVFDVTVGTTTETRSGTITVTGYSNALGSVTERIAVTQTGPGGGETNHITIDGITTFNIANVSAHRQYEEWYTIINGTTYDFEGWNIYVRIDAYIEDKPIMVLFQYGKNEPEIECSCTIPPSGYPYSLWGAAFYYQDTYPHITDGIISVSKVADGYRIIGQCICETGIDLTFYYEGPIPIIEE